MKYLLLDVAGTLLHKPTLLPKMQQVLAAHGYDVDPGKLKYNHKLLSEAIFFPDRTSEEFYRSFNRELIISLGVIPTDALLADIFSACSYLPWEPFADTKFLQNIDVPVGILSNFNTTLKSKLEANFNIKFADILVSEELGMAKPSPEFYRRAVQQIGIDPAEIVYVGDSVKLDLEPALGVGLNAFLIDRDGYFPLQTRRLDSLEQLKDIE